MIQSHARALGSLFLLLLLAVITALVACSETGKISDTTTDATADVTSSAVTDGETDAVTNNNVSQNGVVVEGLNGWFEQGGALIYRDKYEYVGTRSTMDIAMAKNEMEGFQYVLLADENYDDLRCEVSTLIDGNGNTLDGTVFTVYNYCIRNTASWIKRGYVPELLMEQDDPWQGGTFDLVAMRAKTLYVRYITDANTVPGTYTGKLEIKQGDTVLKSHEVSVKVWDIHYDEKTESLGLYQYGYCRGDMGWGGPGPDSAPDMALWFDEETNAMHMETRQQYVDFMLEHRLSPWHLPLEKELLTEDFALVKKYMDNPRLNLTYLYHFDTLGEQADIARENGWFDKIACVLGDEPGQSAMIDQMRDRAGELNALSGITRYNCAFGIFANAASLWMVPQNGPNIAERMGEYSTLHTMNVIDFVKGNPVPEVFWKLKEERGDTVLWYACASQANRSDVVNFLVGTPCTEKRILFWQQYQNDIDGYLQFHTMVWNRKYDFWAEDYEDHRWKPVATGVDGGDGDGMMIYWHPVTKEPIGSLTVEANRDGIEDFQLLRMAEDLLGKDVAMSYAKRITTAVNVYTKDADLLAQVRLELGNAVEAALAR